MLRVTTTLTWAALLLSIFVAGVYIVREKIFRQEMTQSGPLSSVSPARGGHQARHATLGGPATDAWSPPGEEEEAEEAEEEAAAAAAEATATEAAGMTTKEEQNREQVQPEKEVSAAPLPSKTWWCSVGGSVPDALWPELAPAEEWTGQANSENDVLVLGRHPGGACEFTSRCPSCGKYVGKVLWLNGESYGGVRPLAEDSTRYIGALQLQLGPNDKSFWNSQIFYVQMAAMMMQPECCEIDAVQFLAKRERPRSSGKNFMLYLAANCNGEDAIRRQNAFDGISNMAREKGYKQFPHAGGSCHGKQTCATLASEGENSCVQWKAEKPRGHWGGNWRCKPFLYLIAVTFALCHDRHGSGLYDVHRYFKDYRFGLVMENQESKGYVTEKIMNAFIGGAIPVCVSLPSYACNTCIEHSETVPS